MTEPSLFEQASQEWDNGNLRKAFALFSRAAEQGDTSAKHNLGYFFSEGEGMEKDFRKALHWYKQAAREGSIGSMLNIAYMYRDAGNWRRAKFWLSRAIERGDGEAALDLARIYLMKKGRAHVKRAKEYLEIALNSGNMTENSLEEAQKLLQAVVPMSPLKAEP